MAYDTAVENRSNRALLLKVCGAAVLALATVVWPGHALSVTGFVLWGLVAVAPIVVPGIVLAAWIIASGADTHIARAFEGRTLRAVIAASAIGAITPVCGVTVLPLMAGLLAARVPLAPIMAFWLSSPITDPAMLATTAATLGLTFAVGKTTAAFALGVSGGAVTAIFSRRPWALHALRDNGLAQRLSAKRCGASQPFDPRVWKTKARRGAFARQFRATARLILICLIPAFAAEYALNAALTPGSLAAYVGEDQWWAIPAAVFVGAPAYIDGYAALPLTRGLIDNGMSSGAAMAFLVSGGVVSIWGAMAIAPILKLKPFMLYLTLAVLGSLAAGYSFEWLV
ncbi:permease [Roseobacter sp. YSTF-M11]|uniref:Permease n=1 Tax=Roseobacter insulae TaxID=2859783 RepID=A0A9X1K350_9RHOB|nr:permease [Roseobacter insulae]MBW4709213.1 permease [Roseobacter insulae]